MSTVEHSAIWQHNAEHSEIQQVRQALRDAPLLRDLDDRVLERLRLISDIIRVPENTEICRQGEPADRLFIVLEGQVSAFAPTGKRASAVVDVLRAGEAIGLATLLARLPRLLSANAISPCRLLCIEASGLLALVEEEASLVTALLRAEAKDFQALVQQVCDLKLRTTAQRLGCYLLSLSPDQSKAEPARGRTKAQPAAKLDKKSVEQDSNVVALRLPFDKRLLAARLGCRQENLSRAFAALRTLGVETHGARVILHDIAGLRNYALPDEVPA